MFALLKRDLSVAETSILLQMQTSRHVHCKTKCVEMTFSLASQKAEVTFLPPITFVKSLFRYNIKATHNPINLFYFLKQIQQPYRMTNTDLGNSFRKNWMPWIVSGWYYEGGLFGWHLQIGNENEIQMETNASCKLYLTNNTQKASLGDRKRGQQV